MPDYIFDPAARPRKLTFQAIAALADEFGTSLTATAIRLVESDHTPAILICHGLHGRRWFTRSPNVPDRWFPQEQLDAESFAFDVLVGKKKNDAFPRKIGADAWFDRSEADRYEILEQSVHIGGGEILSLILIQDEDMLEDWGTKAGRRR